MLKLLSKIMGISLLASLLIAFALIHFFNNSQLTPKLINSVGLIFDVIGVIYIVYEIFDFQGKKQAQPYGAAPRDMDDWKQFKERHLTRGLSLILVGFFLQLFSNWSTYA